MAVSLCYKSKDCLWPSNFVMKVRIVHGCSTLCQCYTSYKMPEPNEMGTNASSKLHVLNHLGLNVLFTRTSLFPPGFITVLSYN